MNDIEWDTLFSLITKVVEDREASLVKALRLRNAAAERLADMDLYEFSALAMLGEDVQVVGR